MGRAALATGRVSRRIALARETFLDSGTVIDPVRSLVAESWLRCRRQGTGADAVPPVDLAGADLESYRETHPLAHAMPIVRRLLVEDAVDAGFLVAVSDADGRLLWVEGPPELRGRAEGMGFAPGALWSEELAGTNAPGTALALGRPVQIAGHEHLAEIVAGWSCSATPVRGQAGEILGALDITGSSAAAGPYARSLVQAVAAAVEASLPPPVAARAGRRTARAAAAATCSLAVLGRTRAELRTPTATHRLSPRHGELLFILTRHPDGLTTDELAVRLRDEDRPAVTVRAEMSRLRSLLASVGAPELRSRPYRLALALPTDVDAVERALADGDLRRALDAYEGPLLPTSTAPELQRYSADLHGDLRATVLGSGDPDLAWQWASRPWARDDRDAWEQVAAVAPWESARAAAARDRVERLDRALGA